MQSAWVSISSDVNKDRPHHQTLFKSCDYGLMTVLSNRKYAVKVSTSFPAYSYFIFLYELVLLKRICAEVCLMLRRYLLLKDVQSSYYSSFLRFDSSFPP